MCTINFKTLIINKNNQKDSQSSVGEETKSEREKDEQLSGKDGFPCVVSQRFHKSTRPFYVAGSGWRTNDRAWHKK